MTSSNILQYIDDYDIENETKLNRQIYIILKDFIEDDILDLDYSWKKINLFNILFAFLLSFISVLITEDILVNTIKYLANVLGFGELDLISKLNAEKLVTFILFPLGIAISLDIVTSSFQNLVLILLLIET